MDRSRFDNKSWWLMLPILIIASALAAISEASKFDCKHNSEHLHTHIGSTPEVTTAQGRLRGVKLLTHRGRDIFGFKGIPFAEPPVGDLRFKAPVAPGAWDGTLDASDETSDCVQPSGDGNEDCLYLNVYTPRLPNREHLPLLPVMVYVHGGGFKAGSNNATDLGPDYLLDKNVVLVVPSYRLGIFGFFSTGDEVSPGNNGLKDLVKALEWIRDNIEHFGGDPNRTTIFGQSAGGIATHLLALSNLTRGLFQKYVSEGGTALSYDGHRPKEVLAERAVKVGEYLGCPTSASTELVNCLRGVNTSQLLDTDLLFKVWNKLPMVVWSPTTEPDIQGAFLTEKPADLLDTGKIRDLAWLGSCNRDEGINHASRFHDNWYLFEDFLTNIDIALPPWLTYDTRVENVAAYTAALKSYYFHDMTADRTLLLSNFTQLMGDALCAYPTYSAIKKQFNYLGQPQFLGSFQYRGTVTHSKFDGGNDVAHGDELIYLFPLLNEVPRSTGSQMNETDWEMVDTMIQLWTSFATSGTPTNIWKQYSSLENYLRIGSHFNTSLEVQYNFMGNRMQFWEELTAAAKWL